MRKAAILPKLLMFKQLTSELCAHFKVGPEGLPIMVQSVLEVVSEGHSKGMRSATKEPKPEGRIAQVTARAVAKVKAKGNGKGKGKKHGKTKHAKSPDGVKLRDKVAAVIKPGETVTIQDVLDRLNAKGEMPDSNNPRSYLGLVLSTNKDMFANDPKKPFNGRGFYVLRTGKNADLPDYRKPSKKPSVIIAATDLSSSPDLQKVIEALIAAPKSFERRFNTVPLAKLADVTTDVARASLTSLRGHGAIAKLGSTTWRLKDRDILIASKTAATKTKSKAMNGATAHAPS